MTAKSSAKFPVLKPSLQVSFFYRLQTLRGLYLGEALARAVETASVPQLDKELGRYVRSKPLAKVASFGLRGEIFFPAPNLIRASPSLAGYYRLLLGLSQKEFYNKGPFGRFKRLEDRGELPARTAKDIPAFCRSLVRSAEMLVEGIDRLSLQTVHDLQVLTLGPQLRGSQNTKLGQDATREIYELIHDIVSKYLVTGTQRALVLKNDSDHSVSIDFSSDPDVSVTSQLPTETRSVVSMEVKGGTDASNIHNRLGEAEKSHRKAKDRGFSEFWTIIRVDVDRSMAAQESPTTTHFFHLDKICNRSTAESKQFRHLLSSLVGISDGS